MPGVGLLLFSFLTLGFNLVKTWYSIETTHFVIYYHENLTSVAFRSAHILESEVYPKVTEILKNPLDRKTHIVLADIDDIGNGFALEIFDQIFILTADIYYIPIRGRHPWLEDVLTHEFTHIVAMRKARKTPRSVPFFYISAGFFCVITKSSLCSLGGLQDNSTLIGSLAFGVIPYSEPTFFTEGIAQLVTSELGHDSLDSYRNMIIRTLFYHDNLYPLSKLGNYENKRGWEGEIVYNHGFSFLSFIREKYGWNTLLYVMDEAKSLFNFSYETLFEKATGKPFSKLEQEWKEWLREKYSDDIKRYEFAKKQRPHLVSAEVIPLKNRKIGFAQYNTYYVSSPLPYKDGIFIIQDGTLTFYYNKSGYDGIREPERFIGGVQGYAISGTSIVISHSKPTKNLAFFGLIPETYFSLSLGYIVEEDEKGISVGKEDKGKSKEEKGNKKVDDSKEKNDDKKIVGKIKIKDLKEISKRASSPSFSPDGKKIVYVKTEFDSRNIFIYDIEKKEEKRVTRLYNGKQFVFPSFSQDGNFILSAYFDGKQQDIVLIPLGEDDKVVESEDELIFITRDSAEDRDPKFISDTMIMFSSDRDGVFNIYVKDIESGKVWKVTEEISSALYPVSDGENIFHVSFEPKGFRVKKMRFSPENWLLIEEDEKPKSIALNTGKNKKTNFIISRSSSWSEGDEFGSRDELGIVYEFRMSEPSSSEMSGEFAEEQINQIPNASELYLSQTQSGKLWDKKWGVSGNDKNGKNDEKAKESGITGSELNISITKLDEVETESVSESNGSVLQPQEVGHLKLSSPLFAPSIGIIATPFLTASPNFFIPLDIVGLSLETYSFDRLGRFEVSGGGTLGLLGSWSLYGNLSSYHFKDFIPSLFLGVAQLKAIPTTSLGQNISLSYNITQLIGAPYLIVPFIYGRNMSFFISFGLEGERYISRARLSGMTFIPFAQSFISSSWRFFIQPSFSVSFPFRNIGNIGIGIFARGSGVSTNWTISLEESGITSENEGGKYSTVGVDGGLFLSFTIPTTPYNNISLRLLGRSGFFLSDVEIIDEFPGAYPGYFQVFYGDKFIDSEVLLTADIWSGYINIFRTVSFHRLTLLGIFNAFQFKQKSSSFYFSICDSQGFLCSLSGGMVFNFSAFYTYSLNIITILSHGFQDPLRAPIRIYLLMGVGL